MRPLSTSNYWTIACRDSTGSSPDEEKLVDQEVLQFLGIAKNRMSQVQRTRAWGPGDRSTPGSAQIRRSTRAALPRNRWDPCCPGAHKLMIYGAPSRDALCKTLNALLYRLRYWNISVSLPKIAFGVKKCK
jgi:hypothetical protein